MPSVTPPTHSTRTVWAGYACLLALLSVIYFGNLKDLRIDTHDDQTFRDNVALSKDFTYFFAPPEEKQLGSGRPAAELAKWLGYVVWGNDLGWFHLYVVAVHTVATLILARVAWRMGMGLYLSFTGGVLFLINVAHFRAVHWISALDYPLALAWGLGALLCYERYVTTDRSACLWGFCGSMMVGVMSHFSIVVVLPFCLFWSRHRGVDFKTTLRNLLPTGALVLLMFGFLLNITVRTSSTWHSIGLYGEEGVIDLVVGISRVLLWFLSRLLSTAHWHLVPVYRLQTWELFIGAAVLILLLALIWKRNHGAIWSVWVLLSLAPFLLVTETTVLGLLTGPSRYLYAASAGSSLLLALGIQAVSHRLGAGKCIVSGGLVAALLISSYQSLRQAEALSHYTSGRAYAYNRDFETAEQQFRYAIAKGPTVIDLEETYARLCMILLERTEKVEPVLQEALLAFPGSSRLSLYRHAIDSFSSVPAIADPASANLETLKDRADAESSYLLGKTFHNLGLGFETRDNFEKAVRAFRLALEFDSRRTMTRERLVTLLINTGRPQEAVSVALQAVKADPTDGSALHLAAYALHKAGSVDEAISLCHQALRIEPSAQVFGLLADCYVRGGAADQAIDAYRRALELNADHIVIRTKLGLVLYFQGRMEEAIEEYSRALEGPPNSLAQFNLGLAYLAQGRVAEAREVYAVGIERFGATEGARVGAISDLTRLVDRGVQVTVAREILKTYWPEH